MSMLINSYRFAGASPTVPDAPTGLIAVGLDNQVSLTWTAPASNGGSAITDYIVQYRTPAGSGTWNTFSDGVSTVTSATVTGLTNDIEYEFQVAAINAIGTGAYSVSDTAIPEDASSGVTIVQARGATAVTSLSFLSPVTAGNTIFVVLSGWPGGGAAFNAVSDSVNGAHTTVTTVDVQQDTRLMATLFASSAGGNPVISFSGGSDATMGILEISGLNTSSIVRVASARASNNNAAVALSATGTISAGDLVLAYMSHGGGNPNITEDTADGFTMHIDLPDGNSYMPLAIQSLVSPAGASVTPDFAIASGVPWHAARIVLSV